MRVLIIANYAKEHINKFHLSTIKAMKDRGWTVDVACKADADVPFCDHLYSLPLERNPYRPATIEAIKQLKKIINDGKYDVVHCHTYAGKFVGILAARSFRKQGLRIVYSAHGFQYYKGAGLHNWLIFLPIDKWLISNVDLLITSNREDYQTAQKHHFKAKHIEKCCGVGIKLERFDSSRKTREQVRTELGIPQDAYVLIYVAELNHNKNQRMLLRVFDRVRKSIPNCYMILAGPDHFNGKIQSEIAEKGFMDRVLCLGWRNDVPDLIRASDVAVPSSYREGFGLNILEYMYCGIPVVAADNRGHRETIIDGETGFIVPSDDDEAMSEKVIRFFKDSELRESMVRKAYDSVPGYKDETVVSQLMGFYDKYLVSEK